MWRVVLALLVMITATAHAQVTLSVSSPVANSAQGNAVALSVTATSPSYPVAVTASIPTHTLQLTPQGGGLFIGTLSLTTLPQGPVTITITATEQSPGTSTATTQVQIIHDVPPSLAIVAPQWNDVLADNGGVVHATITCVAGGSPCASITLSAYPWSVTFSAASIDQDVVLPAYITSNGYVPLRVTATDTAGVSAWVAWPIWIDAHSTPILHWVMGTDGIVLDADADRALWVSRGGIVWIRHRDTCTDERLGTANWNLGRLTSSGAIGVNSITSAVREYRNGVATDYPDSYGQNFHVAGGFAIWGAPNLHLLDTSTDTQTLVSSAAVAQSADVAANGTVTYAIGAAPSFTSHRWSGGIDTTLGPGNATVTDGTFVAAGNNSSTAPLYEWDSTGAQTLMVSGLGFFIPYGTFAIGAGRLAYTPVERVSNTEFSNTLWVREPDGTQTQLSSDADKVALVTSWGEIFYGRHSSPYGRYRYGASGPEFVNGGIGSPVEHASTAFVLVGRGVFAVDTVPSCTSGPCTTTCGGTGTGGDTNGGSGSAGDAGVDAGPADAAPVDAAQDATQPDAGPMADAGVFADAGVPSPGGNAGPTPAGHGGCDASGVPTSLVLLGVVVIICASRRATSRRFRR